MNSLSEKDAKRDNILRSCFECLVKTGLEKTSMRDLSVASGAFSSSLYYMFKNKDDIVLNSTEYGLNIVVNSLFEYAFSHISNMKEFLNKFPSKVEEFKAELRFIYQVVSSPRYGDRMRQMTEKLYERYDEYTDILAEYLGCSYNMLRPFVRLAIAAVLDYVIWGEQDKMQMEMNCIYDSIIRQMDQ